MRLHACAVLVAVLLGVVSAQAQTLPPNVTASVDPLQPKWEVGGSLGGWLGADGRGLGGLRTGRNFNDWFGLEFGVNARDDEPGKHALFEVRARFLAPPIPGRIAQPFVTAGVVRAVGLSYDISPMFGVGAQSRWDDSPISLRGEIQLATRGEHLTHDRLRVLIGLSVAVKKD